MLVYNYMNQITYKIFYDIEQDAWNWWNSIVTYNQTKKLRTPTERRIGNMIREQDFTKAKTTLLPFLEKRTSEPNFYVPKFQQIMEDQFIKSFHPAIKRLEHITEHPLFQDDFMGWRKEAISPRSKIKIPSETLLFPITTFPCMIAFYAEGVYFTYAKIDDELWGMPLDGTLYELLHLQCQAYWRDDKTSPISKLSENDYYILKESLTVILDAEWKPIITLPDCSYPEFQPLRDKLHQHWQKHHDFDKLMLYGYKEVTKFTRAANL